LASKKIKQQREIENIAAMNFSAGCVIIKRHPLFGPLYHNAWIYHGDAASFSDDGFARVYQNGEIIYNSRKRVEPEVWVRVLAHCLLHLGFDHFAPEKFIGTGNLQNRQLSIYWNCACDLVVERFLSEIQVGARLSGALIFPPGITDERRLFSRFMENGIDPAYAGFGTAGHKTNDMIFSAASSYDSYRNRNSRSWTALFAKGLVQSVRDAVNTAAGVSEDHSGTGDGNNQTQAKRQREWFISSYPLLGAIASSFKVIEDIQLCHKMHIQIAAVSPSLQELYINPLARLSDMECRFVLAHEFLHAALRHDIRHEWRDAYLWNIACDFVINLWLTEMYIGERPPGTLYDMQFKGLSAETVYERIVTDLRHFRKLATLRGVDLGDIIPEESAYWKHGGGEDLDSFYRRCLSQGLSYYEEHRRGHLPAGLIEEIRALAQPPIPWDVELARWFDEHFVPLEKIRSYARPSRRQSSTPDIPRPAWLVSRLNLESRTFGVILDTSGSMERRLLAAALGAIASYAISRDVPAARVVFCDAEAYDQGYMKIEDIARSVKIKGRGGTVLQPGINLLHKAKDFPETTPLLIITDGGCEDRLILYGREHAYLLPEGNRLPFIPNGKVFRVRI
jgi:predicted metal-dependent peptidase